MRTAGSFIKRQFNGCVIGSLVAAAPISAVAQTAPTDRIDAIEQQIKALQGQLQTLKRELGDTKEKLRQSQSETQRAKAQAQQATQAATQAQIQSQASVVQAQAAAQAAAHPAPGGAPAQGPHDVQTAGNRFGIEKRRRAELDLSDRAAAFRYGRLSGLPPRFEVRECPGPQ